MRGLSPNFHIHVSLRDLYISTIRLPILLQETEKTTVCGPILRIFKWLTGTDTRMWKSGLRPRNSFSGNT